MTADTGTLASAQVEVSLSGFQEWHELTLLLGHQLCDATIKVTN